MSKISLGGIPVKIKYKELKDSEHNAFGMFSVTSNGYVIYIDKNLKGKIRKNVILHELVHCIFYHIGATDYDNELLIQSITNSLQEVLSRLNIKNII